jgi:acyl carrier protein
MDEVKTKLRHFIDQEVLFGEGTVADDQDLLGGVLDSLALLQFVEYIEGEFDIQVNDEDMVPDNFRSIDAVAGYVTSRSA